jgi:hypothetical protein
MEDSCYVCRRTQVDLDRLNEEIRTRVYLSYFSNARNQIDEQRRKITFLQRLKDEESGDPHFRISAQQVFGDPGAYKKLMPWIDQLIEIAHARGKPTEEPKTIGALVEELLAEERRVAPSLEEGLEQIRAGFATAGKHPLSLDTVTYSFPVEWSVAGAPLAWRPGPGNEREPLQRPPGDSKSSVEVQMHLCSACRRIVGRP